MKIIEVREGWSRGKNLIPSGLIRRLEDSYFNHVYLVFVFDNGLVLIYESHVTGGVQITPYEHLQNAMLPGGKVVDIFEKKLDMTEDEMQVAWSTAVELHGDRYDKGQILRYYLWIRLSHKKGEKILRLHNDGKYTCNEFVLTVLQKAVPEKYEFLDFSYTPERLFVYENGQRSKEMFK